MPVTYLLGLMVTVLFAAAATIALVVWAEAPIAAVMLAGLVGSLLIGAKQWR